MLFAKNSTVQRVSCGTFLLTCPSTNSRRLARLSLILVLLLFSIAGLLSCACAEQTVNYYMSSECAFTLNGYECESDVTFASEITQCERTFKGFILPYIHICPFYFSSTIYIKHLPLKFEEIISVKPDRRALSSD